MEAVLIGHRQLECQPQRRRDGLQHSESRQVLRVLLCRQLDKLLVQRRRVIRLRPLLPGRRRRLVGSELSPVLPREPLLRGSEL